LVQPFMSMGWDSSDASGFSLQTFIVLSASQVKKRLGRGAQQPFEEREREVQSGNKSELTKRRTRREAPRPVPQHTDLPDMSKEHANIPASASSEPTPRHATRRIQVLMHSPNQLIVTISFLKTRIPNKFEMKSQK